MIAVIAAHNNNPATSATHALPSSASGFSYITATTAELVAARAAAAQPLDGWYHLPSA